MSGNAIWQLFLKGLEGKTYTIDTHKDASVDEFMKKVADKTGIPVREQIILYAGKQLQCGKLISHFHVQNNSTLFMVLRLIGGSGESAQRKELDDLVETTDAPDMITWDDDPDNKRAKMPCGHAIGPESLTAYCRSLLTAGKFRFLCPYVDRAKHIYCGQEWEYFIVRRLAVLTEDEQKEFEKKLCENYLQKAMGIQECARCESLCTRMSSKDRRLICPICTKSAGRIYEFCWFCLNKWKDKRSTRMCGNAACSNEDPRLKILRNAPMKKIVGVKGCPSRRACIHCGLLIEHERDCKHMVCRCGTKFCFICLTPPNSFGRYQCGTYRDACVPAPCQTIIPGM